MAGYHLVVDELPVFRTATSTSQFAPGTTWQRRGGDARPLRSQFVPIRKCATYG